MVRGPAQVEEGMTVTRGSTAATPDRGREPRPERGRVAQVSLFYRQVVAELRKVIWPTRRELITYTSVVLVFVLVLIAYVSVLDYGVSKLVLAVFG